MSDSLPLEPIHDFVGKLRQPSLHGRVVDYVAWQRARRAARAEGRDLAALPDWAPLSINLDLTTACNFACDHCIDWEILNSGINFQDRQLRESLAAMHERGLRSVILIGGGEPTVYPGFVDMVAFLKSLDLHVAVVSNGSRPQRLLDIIDLLGPQDWIRLSLDSGTDATFQAMHKPKKAIRLEEICAGVPPMRARNDAPRIGFSFVITWQGAAVGDDSAPVIENLSEIPEAARLAKSHDFHYISFKPFLTRAPDGAEVMDPQAAAASHADVVRRIRSLVDEAHELEDERFQVLESTNLRLLEAGSWEQWTRQPTTCHMQALRQVLSPLGLYNCPAHRGVDKARIAGRDAFADEDRRRQTADATGQILDSFDASRECREVTCLYHATNWWIESMIEAESFDPNAGDERQDLFL